MFEKLFSPIRIRGMEMRNKVVMPAMGTRMADEQSFVTQRLIDYHVARAQGGSGLNIVEVASVHTPSAPAHFVSISDDKYIEGHRRLTNAIHEVGGKAGIQLWQGSIAVMMDPKAKVLTVNDMPMGTFTLPAITIEELQEIITCYGDAAKRCVEAGYDCIEFHCAHNYLPHSFLSGGLNFRTDEYGGSFENRVKFPLACIQAIRQAIPDTMPLFMRIDAHDDNLPKGLTIEEVIAFSKLANKEGVDVLDVSRGNIITEATIYEVPPIDIKRGFNVDNASKIRHATGMLSIAVGRINTAEMAEEILMKDKADMVVMGRSQLADPEFCNKSKRGDVEDIVQCVGCNQGCYDGFCDVVNRPFITCLRNPALGYEKEYKLSSTTTPKKVYIAGGGVAGLEAAKVLKSRNHQPVLFEALDHLGGQFITAGRAPGKEEMAYATIAFGKQIEKQGIEVHLQEELTSGRILQDHPDEVIIAIGANPIRIPLAGDGNKPVFLAHDVLDGKATPLGTVCVIGGGLVGLETADYLADKGHKVHVVEMLEEAGKDLGILRKIAVMGKMKELGIDITCNATCTAMNDEGVVATQKDAEICIACDSVVMAIGSRSKDASSLIKACEECHIPYHVIGDALKARRALNAISEAFDVARTI